MIKSCWRCIKYTATTAFHQKDPVHTDRPYCFDMNPIGESDAGNLQVRFEVALAGNVTMSNGGVGASVSDPTKIIGAFAGSKCGPAGEFIY
jgi:hypothetical protein